MLKDRIPSSKKDRNWRMGKLRYWSSKGGYSQNKQVIRLLEIVAGKIDFTAYDYVTKPHNLKGSQYQKYPAKLRNYDILSGMFLRAKAYYEKMPFEPVVFTKNSNFNNFKLQKEKELIVQSVQQMFVNTIAKKQLVGEQNQEEQLSPEVIKHQVSSLKDEETIEGQHVLDYMIDRQNVQRKYAAEFYNFLATNQVFTHKEVVNDEVVKTIVSGANIDYVGANNLEFIEDATMVKCRWRFTFEDVVATFQKTLEEQYPGALTELEQSYSNSHVGGTNWFSQYRQNFANSPVENSGSQTRYIDVEHIQFTSYRKVYSLGFDERGDEIIVDEDYDGEWIDERWVEELREGWVVASKYYLGGDLVENCVYDANDPFKVKKNYSGKIFMNDVVQQIPLPEKLIQYQESYNILKWKLQSTINKNKEKLVVMPIGLFTNAFKKDTATDNVQGDTSDVIDSRTLNVNNPISEGLYFADTTQLLFVDESSEQAQLAAQMIKTIDLGLGNYISFLLETLRSVKQEAEEVFGFNRFVTEGAKSSDAVRNVQAGMEQSSVLIELYIADFQSYQQNDMQGMLNLSKYAYRSGRSLTYVRSNTDAQQLTISDKFADSSKGIFIKDSKKTSEVLGILKQEATQMLQNGMKHSVFAKMISQSNNFASIIEDIETAENEMMQQQQAKDNADRQTQMAIQQQQSADAKDDRDLKKYEIDTKANIELEKILSAMKDLSADNPAMLEGIDKLMGEHSKQLHETIRNGRTNKTAVEVATIKADADKYKADAAKSVAVTNK